LDPDRVGGWFTFVWGKASPQTFNVRLAALRAAFDYWREQGWLGGDPLVRLVGRSVPRDDSRALTRAQVTTVLGLEVALRERVLWQMLYETAARAEEVLMLDVPHLDRRSIGRKSGGYGVTAGQGSVSVVRGMTRRRSTVHSGGIAAGRIWGGQCFRSGSWRRFGRRRG
jgi:integrase/recombinase XerC/integrase/recombinase XerD